MLNPVSYLKHENVIVLKYPEWLGSRVKCTDDSTLCRVGLSTMIDMLSGVHKYAPKHLVQRWEDDVLPIEVPSFMKKIYGVDTPMISLVGSLGTSSSIGEFIAEIVGEDTYVGLSTRDLPDKSIIVWGFPTTGGYMIVIDFGFVESVENENELEADASAFIHPADRYIVGGMTDFSGEGGAAARSLLAVMMLIGEIYDIPLEFRIGTWEQYEELSNLCNKAQEEALTGE